LSICACGNGGLARSTIRMSTSIWHWCALIVRSPPWKNRTGFIATSDLGMES